MPNEEFQISLSNKRIFLVKVQAIIFLVGMTFAMCFGGLEALKSFNEINISDILFAAIFGALMEIIFYKICILLLSLILFCKLFYFKNLEQIKKYLLILFLNIFPFYLFILTNKTPYDSPYLIIIVYLICIFIYAISICLMYKFYKSINKISLSFIFINILEIYMLILYGVEILNSLSKLGIIFIEQTFVFISVMLIFWFTLPLAIWLSIPLNLINEYRYFKKELKTKN